ncbi:cytochrome P450 [Trametes versicolor FP-101664 SS1]|uniref:cytochrome P450 n=1 Tax=Trametes versicolor (strain FP-101664) TaxID=717944 RepID=UPI00046224CC|nr:cytochrome P450 [Trametes versicolor FP-101664 SS1]EIW55340.1 cytochrome P450 [Trametes versicolor FP-101664 SS1]
MISQAVVPLIFLLLLYAVKRYTACRQLVRTVNGWPGFRTVFNDRFLFFPFRVRGISPGAQWPFYSKHADFAKAGWDVIALVNALPSPELSLYVADAAIAKEVMGARARFPKPTDVYELLATFGTNILVTEGEEWKRQRKIAAPAFSERNNKLVWDESLRIVNDMFENLWGDKDAVELDHVLDITIPITLMVIGAASFGRRMSWKEDGAMHMGHSLTFKDALLEVSNRLVLSLLFPQWLLRFGTPGMRSYARAYDELSRYLDEMVQERRTSTNNEERYDLFSSLLEANEAQLEGDTKLSDKALLGNVFLFLVAGHDTTSHTLAYALIFLALYQEEQDKFYKNIMAVMPKDRALRYEDMGSFSYSLAVFNETLRHFPPVIGIPKYSAEDTVLTTTSATGEQARLPVPRGTYITISASALHHNPRYWDDPEAFKPARVLGDYPRDAFLPFSGGPRGCIGRGFSETEATAVLTAIVSKYKVEVREEACFAGETFEQRKARLLKSQHSTTIYPERAPLVFRRRR